MKIGLSQTARAYLIFLTLEQPCTYNNSKIMEPEICGPR